MTSSLQSSLNSQKPPVTTSTATSESSTQKITSLERDPADSWFMLEYKQYMERQMEHKRELAERNKRIDDNKLRSEMM